VAAKKSKAKAKPAPPFELTYRTPGELAVNPRQWKTHPQEQMEGLTATMRRLNALDDGDTSGAWAGVMLYNQRTERLIDGHGRKTLDPDLLIAGALVGRPGEKVVPVLEGRWTEEQERIILATLDPIGAKAKKDQTLLDELVDSIDAGAEADLAALLLGMKEPIPEPGDAGDDSLPEEWMILVECKTEAEQGVLLRLLQAKGASCRALIS
jgi:hypothetical protein